MVDIIQLLQNFITDLQIVNDYGLLAVLVAHMSPSFTFIMEGIDTAAVVLGINPVAIVIFAAIGGTIGDFIWFYAGRYSYRKIKKIDKMKSVKIVHRHKKLAFLYTAFPGGEILMVYAGIKHFDKKEIIPYVIASNVLRSALAVGVVTGIITFLPEIVKQIIF